MTRDAELDAVVADALELCAVPAPTFSEDARAEELARRLAAAGAADRRRDQAGNVLARFGPADGPAAIVAAHLDTVFPAGTPLEPRRQGARLHGPGVGDDSLGLAGLLHVARRLARDAPAHPVLLAGTVGEEGLGDLRGARALLEAEPCDAFVALEGHGLESIQTGGIAAARLRATYRAPGGHSWGDRGAPSAAHALLTAGAKALEAVADAHLNVGVIAGGTSINTIAAEASAELDLRDPDDAALDTTRARVERALREATPPGVELDLKPIGRRPGGTTAPDHPLVEAARQARRGAGLPPAEERASSTDANAALGHGLPAISVGLTTGENAHRVDEYVDIPPLAGGLAALDALVDALAAGLPGSR